MSSANLGSICGVCLWLGGVVALARSEDVVHYRTGHDSRLVRSSGEILEYTGSRLRLRTSSGREATIPADRVQRIDSAWSKQHVEGNRLRSRGQFGEAIQQYALALRSENRNWVRQRIYSRITWCCRSLGDYDRAAEAFLFMVRDNPDTPYFDAIPLFWRPYQPSLEFEQRAIQWTETTNFSAVALMGASWLHSGREGSTARQTLKRLQNDHDERVALMARTQLWRNEIVTVTENQLDAWRSTIGQIPSSLRAGPYFVLGRALAHQGRLDEAALALLRVPILYSHFRALAADALLAAGELLERTAQPVQARRLYGELLEKYPETAPAIRAQQHVFRLSSAGTD